MPPYGGCQRPFNTETIYLLEERTYIRGLSYRIYILAVVVIIYYQNVFISYIRIIYQGKKYRRLREGKGGEPPWSLENTITNSYRLLYLVSNVSNNSKLKILSSVLQ